MSKYWYRSSLENLYEILKCRHFGLSIIFVLNFVVCVYSFFVSNVCVTFFSLMLLILWEIVYHINERIEGCSENIVLCFGKMIAWLVIHEKITISNKSHNLFLENFRKYNIRNNFNTHYNKNNFINFHNQTDTRKLELIEEFFEEIILIPITVQRFDNKESPK